MNSAACLISGTWKHDHITPVLGSLHWLPVEHKISYKLECLMYKALHGLAPPYLVCNFYLLKKKHNNNFLGAFVS